ncbi:MAG TPA: hypothetical protein VFA66_05740 [Gaiellaceae bacterium]|nr:hypothetical protein [Gaiellaceae bacterium]
MPRSAVNPPAVRSAYAVLWSGERGSISGRLEPLADRFELSGREERVSIPYAEVVSAAIDRRNGERLQGLPVLVLRLRGRTDPLRIASMEGAGVLHELARHFAARRARTA